LNHPGLRIIDAFLFFGTMSALVFAGAVHVLRRSRGKPALSWRRFFPMVVVIALSATQMLSPVFERAFVLLALLIIVAEAPLNIVLIPLGCVRLTHWLATMSDASRARHEAELQPLVLAARALRRRPSTRGARFIEERLAYFAELGPLGATASAILAEVRGDTRGAIQILRGVDSLGALGPRALFGPALREVVLHYALTIDDDFEVSWFSDPKLTAMFEKAKAKRTLFDETPPASVAPNLNAVAALARRLPNRARKEDVTAALASLDSLRGSSRWHDEFDERACALGLDDVESAKERLFREAEAELAAACIEERWPIRWFDNGPAGRTVRSRVRDERRATVERLADELRERSRQRRDLPELEEWRAWGEFVRASQLLENDSLDAADHELHFRSVHSAIWSYGYRQGFVLGRRSLASAVFLYQRKLAYAAKAADTYDVIEGNLSAAQFPAAGPLESEDALWLCDPRRVAAMRALNVIANLGAIGVMTTLCIWAFKGEDAVTGILASLVFALILQRRWLLDTAIVALLAHEGRVIVQTLKYCTSVDIAEIELCPSFGGLSRVKLKRSPFWLPRAIWTAHASPDDAVRARRLFAQRVQSTET
jgi:hypothetical protein